MIYTKKHISVTALTLILLRFAFMLYAHETDTAEQDKEHSAIATETQDKNTVPPVVNELQTEALSRQGIFQSSNSIAEETLLLTEKQRLALQQPHGLNYTRPMLLNWLVGFGVGNFLNGDIKGGFTHLGIESVAGLSYIIANSVWGYHLFTLLDESSWWVNDSPPPAIKSMEFNMYVAMTSLGILVADRIVSIISVSIYTARYNTILTNASIPPRLGISIYASPVITPDRFGFAFNIKY